MLRFASQVCGARNRAAANALAHCANGPQNESTDGNARMNLASHIKAVLWSSIGLGRRQDMAELHKGGNPLVLILVAFVFVILFLAGIYLLVRFAVTVA
jgi:hypothetical protein